MSSTKILKLTSKLKLNRQKSIPKKVTKNSKHRKSGIKLKPNNNSLLKLNLIEMEPMSPISTSLEGHLQLLKETATYHFPDSGNNYVPKEIINYSDSNINGWKMIHNALFNKLYDKRIIMKTYLDRHKKEQFQSVADKVSK